jgi:peptidoglycan/xylan/chitin deacetylase (PgdA/CDA1 family)
MTGFGSVMNRLRNFRHPRILVLMYHRIDDVEMDPWKIAVHPRHFEAQLQVLTKWNVIPASRIGDFNSKKSFRKPAVCITFDDGYRDNVENALPLLEKYECPASFFINTSYIGKQKEFWWDMLESIFLSDIPLPEKIELSHSGEKFEFDLGQDANMHAETMKAHTKDWIAWEKAPGQRHEIFYKVWDIFRKCPPFQRDSMAEQLLDYVANHYKPDQRRYPLSDAQFELLADHPLINIGAHTHSHPALPALNYTTAREEILLGKTNLEARMGKKVWNMSYPFGSYNKETLALLAELDIDQAFTTEAIPVEPHSHTLRMGRYQVMDLDGDAFEKQLQQWFLFRN